MLFEQIDQNNSIIVGDLNAHNPLWDSKTNDAKGQALLDVINNHYFVILNNGKHTLSIHNTTPDITLASPTISANWEWQVLQQTCGSDHLPILIKLNVRYNTTGSSGISKWKLGKADWDKFKTLCSSKLKLNKNSETINEIASDFTNILQNICEETIPKTKPNCSKIKPPWWNRDCAIAIKNVKKHVKILTNKNPTG